MAARSTDFIEGTVSLDPALASQFTGQETLFVIARSGQGGPPLAVKRLPGASLPYHFRLSQDDVMMQGRPFVGPMTVTARLDKDGAAGPASSGDLVAPPAGPIDAGQTDISIVINEQVP